MKEAIFFKLFKIFIYKIFNKYVTFYQIIVKCPSSFYHFSHQFQKLLKEDQCVN